jgi:hypothetical protein
MHRNSRASHPTKSQIFQVISRYVMLWKRLPPVKSFASPAVQEFLDSDEWRAMNYGDFLLHEAANQSLDRTIERLG